MAYATKDISIVESLSDSMDLDFDLLKVALGGTSTPKCPCVEASTPEAPKKKLKMSTSAAKGTIVQDER